VRVGAPTTDPEGPKPALHAGLFDLGRSDYGRQQRPMGLVHGQQAMTLLSRYLCIAAVRSDNVTLKS